MESAGCWTPWVRERLRCTELLKYHPTVIRGNASEIMALAGANCKGRGVDSTDSSSVALEAGKSLARECKCVVGISGEVDYVTDGERVIESGSVWGG